jgi:hypothetical protein
LLEKDSFFHFDDLWIAGPTQLLGIGFFLQIGECAGVWWRPNFETLMYPYCPPHINKPKVLRVLLIRLIVTSKKNFLLNIISFLAGMQEDIYCSFIRKPMLRNTQKLENSCCSIV